MQVLYSSRHQYVCKLEIFFTCARDNTVYWQFFTSVMCKNPEFFNDPNTFDPSRFDSDKSRYDACTYVY